MPFTTYVDLDVDGDGKGAAGVHKPGQDPCQADGFDEEVMYRDKARKVFNANLEPTLLEGEILTAKAQNVLKYNSLGDRKSGISGVLCCTTFRLSFVTANRSSYNLPGNRSQRSQLFTNLDIPLTNIDAVYHVTGGRKRKLTSGSNLPDRVKTIEVHCKDFQICSFSFKFSPLGEDTALVSNVLLLAFPRKSDLLFAFAHNPPPLPEGRKFAVFSRVEEWEAEMSRMPCNMTGWRVSQRNTSFILCDRMPQSFVVPSNIVDADLTKAAPYYVGNRVPCWSWSHRNGCALVRMSILSSDTMEGRQQESFLLEGVRLAHPCQRHPLTVQVNKVCPTVKEIASAYNKLAEICMPDGSKKFWSGDGLWWSQLEGTQWLQLVKSCLNAAADVAKQMRKRGYSIVLQEPEGSDVSCVISSLTQLLLDKDSHTLIGFQQLVQKEWVASGHRFLDRLGLLVPAAAGGASDDAADQQQSPVFLLFLDCTWQLLQWFPDTFEFTETFLTVVWDCVSLGFFDHFIFNGLCHKGRMMSDLERDGRVPQLLSMWDWDKHAGTSVTAMFQNPLYVLANNMQLKQLPDIGDDDAPRNLSYLLAVGADIGSTKQQEKQSDESKQVAVGGKCSTALVQLWSQCYLRWLPPAHVIGGGAVSEFFQQCSMLSDIVQLHGEARQLVKELGNDPEIVLRENGGHIEGEDHEVVWNGMHETSAYPFVTGTEELRSSMGTPLITNRTRHSSTEMSEEGGSGLQTTRGFRFSTASLGGW